jgi:hypothetical protein
MFLKVAQAGTATLQRVGVRAQLSTACRLFNNTTPVSYLAAVVGLLLNHARVAISIYLFI